MRRRSTRRKMSTSLQRAVNFNEFSNKRVQASDGFFFEAFSNAAPAALDASASPSPKNPPQQQQEEEGDAGGQLTIVRLSIRDSHQTLNDLYLEALYTIVHRVGKQPSVPDAQLIRYAQNAFQVDERSHQQFMERARREKPPVVLLNVQLIEARDLIAKDINGFSDPFAMLGIVPGRRRKLPAPHMAENGGHPSHSGSISGVSIVDDDDSTPPISPSSHRNSGSGPSGMLQRFGGSFRRKFERGSGSGSRKGVRGALMLGDDGAAIPAKLIKASSVQMKTLNPRWGERFQFIVDDVSVDRFHLDIWDHDDEERSVLDAVTSLNQVHGLKGLGRYFKEVTQSARQGSDELVDDFLGSVTLRIKDIPSSGVEEWLPLERRSEKSDVSGAVLLKLWLSTKEERGDVGGVYMGGLDDDLLDVKQHIELIRQFALQEIRASKAPVSFFQGALPEAAVTILHQHAVQGDLNELHQAMCQWLAYSVMVDIGLSYGFLFDILERLICKWRTLALDKEEENMLALSFAAFNDACRRAMADHRTQVSVAKRAEVDAFGNMLRCLKLLRESSIYEKCVPYARPFAQDVHALLVDSATGHFASLRQSAQERKLANACEELTALVEGLNEACAKMAHFEPLFKANAGLDYHEPTYGEFDRLLYEHVSSEMTGDLKGLLTGASDEEAPLLQKLKLHFALNEFARFRPAAAKGSKTRYRMEEVDWSAAFERAFAKWLDLARVRAFARVELSFQLDAEVKITSSDIKHTSSYVDLCHINEQLMWTAEHAQLRDVALRAELTEKMVSQIVCKVAEYFIDRTMTQLAADGFCGHLQPFLPPALVNIFCAAINNSEQLRRSVAGIAEKLHLDELSEQYEKKTRREAHWRQNVERELFTCDGYIGRQIEECVDRMVRRQLAQLKKHVFHLAWSPSACPLDQSIKPLTDMLDAELSTLHKSLLHRNFIRVLHSQVNQLLQLFKECVADNPGLEPGFYGRLSEAWAILMEFFHAEGKGISLDAFEAIPAHKALMGELALNQLTTIGLTELYYKQLLKEQNEVTECRYGILNLRAYYNANSQTLVIDVIGAKQVIPLDTNGLSDPYVAIELVPRARYAHAPVARTKVVNKNLNPLFDETFEFHIGPKLPPSAMVHFVVMDHDFLRSNDFAGEAFLDLAEVPGFVSSASSTLRQFNLILIHPSRKAQESIIHVLASRKDDKEAQEFVSAISASY